MSKTCNIEDNSLCFHKKNGSRDWYVLIYKLFSDKVSAMASLEEIPPDLKAYKPWIRKISDIQVEIVTNGDGDEPGQLSASTSLFP
jgi:septal ring-binding cell division protein DamX